MKDAPFGDRKRVADDFLARFGPDAAPRNERVDQQLVALARVDEQTWYPAIHY